MHQTCHVTPRRKKNRSKTRFLWDSTVDSLDFEEEGNPFCFYDDELVTLDEFESLHSPPKMVEEESTSTNHQRIDPPVRTVSPRKKAGRRRQIDPTTCEREYTADEVEFMNALSEYKRNSGRMFPTCSEILEVLKGLGYEKYDSYVDSDEMLEDDMEPEPMV